MAEKVTKKSKEESQSITPLIITQPQQDYVICDVCGHANPIKTAICKKCSNYIKERK